MALSWGMVTVVEGEGGWPWTGGCLFCICGATPALWALVSAAASRAWSAAWTAEALAVSLGGLEEVLLLTFETEPLRPIIGRLGSALDIALRSPLILPVGDVFGAGRGGAMHGDRRYSCHVLGSKKSTGYSSLVYLLKKHFPSSGRSA